jgi:hypothetical protein
MRPKDFVTTPTRHFFKDKWYIREDFRPEPFYQPNLRTGTPELKYYWPGALNLYEVGNCYNTRQEAFEKCNLIRSLLGIPLLLDKTKKV